MKFLYCALLLIAQFSACLSIEKHCKPGVICGYDCGHTPVKLETMQFKADQLTFPSSLTGTVTVMLNRDQQRQLKESNTSLSVNGIPFTNEPFCSTFPTMCQFLDGDLKFVCNVTAVATANTPTTYKCTNQPQVVFPDAPTIDAGVYDKVKFEVSHPKKGVLECVVMTNLKIAKNDFKQKRSIGLQKIIQSRFV